MKNATSQACGKIILSGEYAVVFGYPGIAVPAPFTVTATWTIQPRHTELMVRRAHHDTITITYGGIDNEAYLHRILDEVQKYTGQLSGYLAIENTIPIGRGMGSSTALVIAICRCLLGHPPLPFKGEDKNEGYKQIALFIEDTVNPGHSGLDFEVIWNEKPILLQKDKPTKVLDIPINLLMGTCSSQVLIDTGKPHETTTEMVRWAKERFGNPHPPPVPNGYVRAGYPLPVRPGHPGGPSKGEGMRALKTIARCTERLLTVSKETCHPERSRRVLYDIIHDHHRAQVALGIVPEPVQALIADIEKAGGAAKVVGAGGQTGGGGMVLALHPQAAEVLAITQQHNMPTLALTQIHPPLSSLP